MKYFVRFLIDKIKSAAAVKFMVATLAFVVLISQIFLSNDSFRAYLTNVDILDGTVPVNSEYEPQTGYVTLCMTDGQPSEDIKILVNGEIYDNFDEQKKKVEIKLQSVIEVLNNSPKKIAVTAEEFSENVTATLNNGNVTVENIGVITRVIFK